MTEFDLDDEDFRGPLPTQMPQFHRHLGFTARANDIERGGLLYSRHITECITRQLLCNAVAMTVQQIGKQRSRLRGHPRLTDLFAMVDGLSRRHLEVLEPQLEIAVAETLTTAMVGKWVFPAVSRAPAWLSPYRERKLTEMAMGLTELPPREQLALLLSLWQHPWSNDVLRGTVADDPSASGPRSL